MAIRNTEQSFGAAAKAFHWVTALLVLGSYTCVITLDFLVRATDPWRRVLWMHQWLGFTIFFLVAARLYWRLANKYPVSTSVSKFETNAAHVVHFVLYFFLLTMPLTGWAGSKMNRTYFDLFEVPSFYNTPLHDPLVNALGMTAESFEKAMDFYHYGLVGPYLLWTLIVLHIIAALYHHFIRRDATLKRMLPGGGKAEPAPKPASPT